MSQQYPDYWTMQEAIRELPHGTDAVEQFRRRSLLPTYPEPPSVDRRGG